ncbi:protein of unknown function [Paenibacillaceae bacterium GAS479]|nr:protein of unknown function [Paenibacillaceae bacterium GAS479]
MESFMLTRFQMADLLLSLNGGGSRSPIQIVQEAWKKEHRDQVASGKALPAFLSTEWPSVLEKLIKGQGIKGVSLQEAAALGGRVEYSSLSITAMQNWVKRDFKPFFESPKAGKKYSLEQAALLFIVDDLKASLDFESIRKLFERLFRASADGSCNPLLGPIEFYRAYSSLFEEMDADGDQILDSGPGIVEDSGNGTLELRVREAAGRYVSRLNGLEELDKEMLGNMLLIAVFSVQAAYFHALTRRYCNATLFLN